MNIEEKIIKIAARSSDIPADDLTAFFSEGIRRTYAPNEWLFHESMPRKWAGIILEGKVELVRGVHGSSRHIATIIAGTLISEGAFLEAHSHSNSAFTRHGTTVWQISTEKIADFRTNQPALFHRIVARIAVSIYRRLRELSNLLYERKDSVREMGGFRTEQDSLGNREVSDYAYYGVQTIRAMENFSISGIQLRNFSHLIEGLALVKKAAAMANFELGVLEEQKMRAIAAACDDLLAGNLHEHFVVDMFQGGAGTSSNMNANEVIANRGLELMNREKGDYRYLHPNDDVNCSQSTNDAYPTAIKLAVLLANRSLINAMTALKAALDAKGEEFGDVLKMGRTENQDAVPMTLGQEFSAYGVMIESAIKAIERAAYEFLDINMGATAIGTGINSPPGYADLVTHKLSMVSGFELRRARNLIEATQNAGSFCQMSSTLKRAAVQISKICNDLRWLSSGPRCGLNEINLPPMQPGSSIMPGKVNPVIPELVNQVCYQVMGYDAVVSMAAEASELELCMAEPIIAYDLLHGMMILTNACVTLTSRCINGIEANRDVCRGYVENSIGLVTALVPYLGYDRCAAIAKEALKTGNSVAQLVLEKELLTQEQLNDILRPESMTDPRLFPKK